MMRTEKFRPALAIAMLLSMLGTAACSVRTPSAAGGGAKGALTLRDLQISGSGGQQAVLLRLSRVPDAVRYTSSEGPAQVIVEAYGPAGEGDLPEKVLPQRDPIVKQVRVSREGGALRITLDLHGDQPPAHQVHEMADWLMVRLSTSQP